MNRAWVAILIMCFGCQSRPPPPPPPLCVQDSDCPDPNFFFCDTVEGTCQASCRSNAQCTTARPPQFALPECENPLGCWCEYGRCVVTQCSDDSQCGALACRNGQCVTPPQTDAVARCTIWPAQQAITPGAFARFHVLATDASGEPVVISSGASWQAMGTIIGPAQGHSIEVVASATPTAGPVTAVRANFGSTQCEAKWIVLPAPATGELLTSVIEEGSGLPVSGAQVVLSSPLDGTIIDQQVTDASGLARLTPVDSTSTLSVFHADFSFQTIANIEGKTRTIFFALERNRADRHGGYVGRFFDVPVTSNMHLARAGLSTSGDVLELTDEVETTIPTNITIGSAVSQPETPIPMATFMSFGDQSFKPTVTAWGSSGQCADAALTASGSCSVQSAWALSADIRLGDLPLSLDRKFSTSLMETLERAPYSGFKSTVIRDLDLRLRPAPLTTGGFPDLRDTSSFTAAPLPFGQLRLGLHFVAQTPSIPRTAGRYLNHAIASGVALVPGRGLVPLGVGTAANEMPVDPQLDRVEPLRAGEIALHMAPPHHGLEGQPTAMVLQLFNRRSGSEGRETSALLAPLPATLPYDPLGLTPIDLRSQSFPDLVKGEFRAGTRSFTAAPVAGVSLVRVTFTDGLEGQWDVLVDAAAPAFTLPAVPGTLRDRVFRDGTGLTGEASQRRVSALRFAGVRPFDELIGENPAARPPGDLTAWSHVDAVVPSVAFASTPAVLPHGTALELRTFGFEPGRDGSVQVSYEGGSDCPAVTLASAPLRFTPSVSCRGQSVVIRAELLDLALAPLDPRVTTSFTAKLE